MASCLVLCHAIACFEQNIHTQISGGDSVLSTIFVWGSCSGHFCSMNHYNITIGNDVARDIHCDIIMGHQLLCAHIIMLQCMMMLLELLFIMYYYTQL